MEVTLDAQNVKNDNIRDGSETYTDQTIGSLSNGFLEAYKPGLEKAQKQLNELCEKQAIVIEQLHNENVKISNTQHSADLQEIFNTVKLYGNKLQNIKKEMKSLHERSTKLKKRAIRLQQHKEKEIYVKNQQKEIELQREQDLIAKPNSSG